VHTENGKTEKATCSWSALKDRDHVGDLGVNERKYQVGKLRNRM
jgi:hypothetical protein